MRRVASSSKAKHVRILCSSSSIKFALKFPLWSCSGLLVVCWLLCSVSELFDFEFRLPALSQNTSHYNHATVKVGDILNVYRWFFNIWSEFCWLQACIFPPNSFWTARNLSKGGLFTYSIFLIFNRHSRIRRSREPHFCSEVIHILYMCARSRRVFEESGCWKSWPSLAWRAGWVLVWDGAGIKSTHKTMFSIRNVFMPNSSPLAKVLRVFWPHASSTQSTEKFGDLSHFR